MRSGARVFPSVRVRTSEEPLSRAPVRAPTCTILHVHPCKKRDAKPHTTAGLCAGVLQNCYITQPWLGQLSVTGLYHTHTHTQAHLPIILSIQEAGPVSREQTLDDELIDLARNSVSQQVCVTRTVRDIEIVQLCQREMYGIYVLPPPAVCVCVCVCVCI